MHHGGRKSRQKPARSPKMQLKLELQVARQGGKIIQLKSHIGAVDYSMEVKAESCPTSNRTGGI
jgi:hypothetical protein